MQSTRTLSLFMCRRSKFWLQVKKLWKIKGMIINYFYQIWISTWPCLWLAIKCKLYKWHSMWYNSSWMLLRRRLPCNFFKRNIIFLETNYFVGWYFVYWQFLWRWRYNINTKTHNNTIPFTNNHYGKLFHNSMWYNSSSMLLGWRLPCKFF